VLATREGNISSGSATLEPCEIWGDSPGPLASSWSPPCDDKSTAALCTPSWNACRLHDHQCFAIQFKTMMIGVVGSCTIVFIRKRWPSDDTMYCCLLAP
jgi:hypothetical protein